MRPKRSVAIAQENGDTGDGVINGHGQVELAVLVEIARRYGERYRARRVVDVRLERAVALNRDDYWSQRLLLATYGLLGRRDDASRLSEAMTTKLKDYRDPLSIRAVAFWYPFANADDATRLATGLRRAGVPD